ncbi:bifunctional hydroxymethylpyrimidine kinase/phosphomethylpyrimidine kinase [Aquidulcibacter sp.]|jgi:pyridoxine kinase|uniref:bifunctional hydroxymethylpyrimidine kinase/phosphomethylpyrimidine kinase n=1 Tax=Aquidulcibacter sp. TaxID=2052990 RepID=UPI0022C95696|nr:bifunctional hydroxymethylpyrimidine kinase/phosphomethylpyrimidine kinase [Aquidulcibacter sp.]MCE2890013.1 bifunctional hydroxymethylpyrimidine kinase/phosphomethylpyrimidine kinase [Hyphomonadaceae bacterium]MCZ8207446.1 bifunctional hydroxymethylpyrimidine kinase/phosphomethylpyrimidine kinase [Aquidulcibacter sp.]
MPLVLILGSHVAGSRVGGTLASLALAQSPMKIDPVHVPTTLLGRHPGWGPPGGGPVSPELFAGMLEGIAANGLFAAVDGVLTDYFASAEQVQIAARAIDAVKTANPKAIIMVDPVLGDAPGGLYVGQGVADALAEHLVPRADFLTPNLWELGYLTQTSPKDLQRIHYAATALGRPSLISSVERNGEIGGMLVDGSRAWLATHAKAAQPPKGTGDLMATMFLAHLIDGQTAPQAMGLALAGVSYTVQRAQEWGAQELPIIAAGDEAWRAEPLALTQLS